MSSKINTGSLLGGSTKGTALNPLSGGAGMSSLSTGSAIGGEKTPSKKK
jgi:hypothetical protein